MTFQILYRRTYRITWVSEKARNLLCTGEAGLVPEQEDQYVQLSE
jgi:hypothetical protein